VPKAKPRSPYSISKAVSPPVAQLKKTEVLFTWSIEIFSGFEQFLLVGSSFLEQLIKMAYAKAKKNTFFIIAGF
jgi:hypothetical protein